ncbi:tetratricopeptide repeat protein [Pendulispora albinea]|uniref:Tetratricopeptide repeat protein n=1 Tax=Pendulispora albinea TaxID=2741071 RepID=A0ABZ2LKX6_9BACT
MTRISDMVLLLFAHRMYHFRRALATAACTALLAASFASFVSGCSRPTAIERARSLTREHKDADAVRVLTQRLEEAPEDRAARGLLIRILAAQGDLGRARAEVDELQRRSPRGDPTPLIELGHAYELAHRFEEALAAYDEAATVAPESPAGPREGGMRAARWGEVEQARPRLEQAIRRGARDAEIWHALGLVCVHLRDLPSAERAYREGLAVDPTFAANALGLATVAVMKNDPKSALAAYDTVLARNPRYSPAELGRAWSLTKLGRKDEARRALDHAAELGASAAQVAKLRAWMEKPAPAADPALSPAPPPAGEGP